MPNYNEIGNKLAVTFVCERNKYSLCPIFHAIICQVVAYGMLKILALKVVAVAYERQSLTRGSKYSDLTWKL